MTVIGFTVTFYSPFRVGASYGRDGAAIAVDWDDPLPADHLKGVMRAAAAQFLGSPGHPAIGHVFGHRAAPCPWAWSSAVPAVPGGWAFSSRHRVQIDGESHVATKDHLVQAEQAWAGSAHFTITRTGLLAHGAGLAEDAHVTILRCAAAGVHGLGGWRRRGLGWVGITPDVGPVTDDDVAVIQAIARGGSRPNPHNAGKVTR